MKIGPQFTGLRNPKNGSHRPAFDQDDSLVSIAYLRQVTLTDDAARFLRGCGVKNRIRVFVTGSDTKYASAASIVYWLDDDPSANAIAKIDKLLDAARNNGFRAQLREP